MSLQLLTRRYDLVEAQVLLATLKAHGFHAMMGDQALLTVSPQYVVTLGGIRLLVPAAQHEEASLFLTQLQDELFVDDDNQQDGESANETDAQTARRLWWMTIPAILWSLGVGSWMPAWKRYKGGRKPVSLIIVVMFVTLLAWYAVSFVIFVLEVMVRLA